MKTGEQDKIEGGISNGIAAWFLNNPVAANLLMFVILVLGVVALGKVHLESFPQFPPKHINITVPYQGGTPENVEAGVAIKVEKAIDDIPGIRSIYSNSYGDKAVIDVEIIDGYDLAVIMQHINSRIEAIENLPNEAEPPIIAQEIEETNVVWVNIHGDVSENSLKQIAVDLREKLLRSSNITTVNDYGLRKAEISINFDQDKLSQYKISLSEVADSLKGNSLDLGIGSLKTDSGKMLLRVNEERRTAYEFSNVLVRSDEYGNTLHLRDIADVIDDFERQEVVSMFNGVPSIMLEIKTQGDTDVLKAYSDVKTLVDEYQIILPEAISVVLWNNMTREVSDRLAFFASGGFVAMLMVLVMLAIFINIKLAFWVAIGIPVSFAGALALMTSPMFGFSLNAITLFAFILVLGIVVDDAIIVGESVFEAKQKNNSPAATLKGLKAVSIPATFGVLTTVAAFWPLTQLKSDLGLLLGQLAWVVIFCLLFSLVESKFILPSHLKSLRVKSSPRASNVLVKSWQSFQQRAAALFPWSISHLYEPALKFSIRYRYLTCMSFISLLFISVALMNGGVVKSIFFPEMDQEYLQAEFDLKAHVTQEHAKKIAHKINSDIRHVSEKLMEEGSEYSPVKGVYSLIQENQIIVVAELAEMTKRDVSGNTLSKFWRSQAGELVGVETAKFQIREPDIEIELYSDNWNDLKIASEYLVDTLKNFKSVTDVYRNVKEVREEIQIKLTDLGRSRGISEEFLSTQIRNAFYGLEVKRLQLDEEVNVMLRLDDENRASIADLLDMKIIDTFGNEYLLGAIAELEIGPGLDQLSRENGERVMVVKASVNKSVLSPDIVVEQLEERYLQEFTEAFPNIRIRYAGDVEEDNEAQLSLMRSFWISILLIYILLAIPLRSYSKPLVIISVIPFGLIGAVIGHLIIGIPFSILSFFGLLALGGVMVNDSLILVFTINQRRLNGEPINSALIQSAKIRFRSVVLTSMTTFVGLIPFIFDESYQAQFLIPTAVSLGFGIVFSTFIILLMVPSIYCIATDIKSVIHRYFNFHTPVLKIDKSN